MSGTVSSDLPDLLGLDLPSSLITSLKVFHYIPEASPTFESVSKAL